MSLSLQLSQPAQLCSLAQGKPLLIMEKELHCSVPYQRNKEACEVASFMLESFFSFPQPMLKTQGLLTWNGSNDRMGQLLPRLYFSRPIYWLAPTVEANRA